jgi:translation elongation factor EF-Tu-like GTPase
MMGANNVNATQLLLMGLIAFSTSANAGNNEICQKSLVNMPKASEVPAQVTLFARNGNIGRSSGINHNYRPQLNFSALIDDVHCQGSEVTCEIHIPKPNERIEPGQTLAVIVNCDSNFTIIRGKPSFKMLEAGRIVGEGVLQ